MHTSKTCDQSLISATSFELITMLTCYCLQRGMLRNSELVNLQPWLSWIQFSFCLPDCSEHPKFSVWSTTLHSLVRLLKLATTFVKNALPFVTTFVWLWYASSSAWDRLAMDGWGRRPNLCNLELAQSCILFMDQPLNGHDFLWYIPDFCQREWSCISITRTLCLGKTLGLSGWSITLEPC